VERCGLDLLGSRQGLVAGSCEHGNERLGFIKAGTFLTRRATISFLRKILLHGVSEFDGPLKLET
jgi:hypothetical protein